MNQVRRSQAATQSTSRAWAFFAAGPVLYPAGTSFIDRADTGCAPAPTRHGRASRRPADATSIHPINRATPAAGRAGPRDTQAAGSRAARRSLYGSGRRRTVLTMLKMAVLAPTPSASTATTAMVNDGA